MLKRDTQPYDREKALRILDDLKAALVNSMVKIKRTGVYDRKKAGPGKIFYTIKYWRPTVQLNKRNEPKNVLVAVYNGAYEMDLGVEAELLAKDKINLFLLSQVAKELIKEK